MFQYNFHSPKESRFHKGETCNRCIKDCDYFIRVTHEEMFFAHLPGYSGHLSNFLGQDLCVSVRIYTNWTSMTPVVFESISFV